MDLVELRQSRQDLLEVSTNQTTKAATAVSGGALTALFVYDHFRAILSVAKFLFVDGPQIIF